MDATEFWKIIIKKKDEGREKKKKQINSVLEVEMTVFVFVFDS